MEEVEEVEMPVEEVEEPAMEGGAGPPEKPPMMGGKGPGGKGGPGGKKGPGGKGPGEALAQTKRRGSQRQGPQTLAQTKNQHKKQRKPI